VVWDDPKLLLIFRLLNVLPTLPADGQPLECIQEEGDLIFVPSGWWHLVYNINNQKEGDDGLCIAMTHNYCSTINFDRVAAILEDDQDSSFAPLFKETLQTTHPELHERWLEIEKKLKTNRKQVVRELGLP
jgi:hypothetical protein